MKLFHKSPADLRREAEGPARPPARAPQSEVDRSKLPRLAAEPGPGAEDAASAWLARTCPELVEGCRPAASRCVESHSKDTK